MKKSSLFFLFFCFAINSICFSQDAENDSIDALLEQCKSDTQRVNLQIQIALNLLNTDLKGSSEYAQRANQLAEKISYRKGEAYSYYAIAESFYVQGDFEKSKLFYNKSLVIYTELNDDKGIAETKNHLGALLHKQGNNNDALTLCIDALKLFEKIKYKSGIASAYINVGLIYDNLQNYDKAIEFYNKAIVYAKEVDDLNTQASANNNLGGIYTDTKKYDLAIEHLTLSMQLKEKIGNKVGVGSSLNNLGAVYYEMKELDKALEFFKKALEIKTELGDKNGIFSSTNNIGSVYLEKKDYQNALSYFKTSHELALKLGSKYNILYSLENLSNVYKAFGDYKTALGFQEQYASFKDTIYNAENSKNIAEVQAQFETEKKQQENEILSLKLKNESFLKYLFIALTGLFLFAAFYIFKNLRQKQKINKSLEEKNRIIEEQKLIVEEQNRGITDSIKYAKRLQEAILPPLDFVKSHLNDFFIFYKPKDIVAGDFYWVETKNDWVYVAAADCTGHGVPGAMVSVVCCNALNRALLEYKEVEPGKILDKTRELVLETFSRSDKDVKDGMDISLCAINKKTNEVKWAGANNALWIVENNSVKEIASNKQAIGKVDNPVSFTTHSLQLEKDTWIYLTTDGFADQFGGEKGKKFKYKPLKELLLTNSNLTPEEQKEKLQITFTQWQRDLEQVDDVCIVGVRL
ncbi:MAG: tetratricopeptide repeat protein [Bacteroidota bacterium]